ncbi:30S ribosomal protein S20 [Virgibacillus alimentarius]|uniref:Small ribosomal subunit protein bS20 n=1 Tax=Virgibacillus alimentarius TaxID=698769 RepID=A0ABS4S4Z6_9BACI|nr:MULTISPECIES: 30S ribosomal protein S20 [Virgibacillus]MBP2256563.1 small subunit ribosomal protein S20 [Virgibacillus alimentarius]HLR66509.1 30S ribosomal protein S20 [Virgibacillus sp.]
MANIKSAIKRVKTNETKRENNRVFKSAMRTQIKHVENLIEENDAENAKAALENTIKQIDKAIQKGVVHPNNGNRQKSRLKQKINQLGA